MGASRLGLYELLASQFVDGACPFHRDFRRSLLASGLGVAWTSPSGPMSDLTFVRLPDGVGAFRTIPEPLRAGSIGHVERLWTRTTPYGTPITPLDRLADPDGEVFDLVGTLALIALASTSET